MLFINGWINLCLYLRFQDMINGQTQRHSSQWASPGRVPIRHRLSIEFSAIGIRSPEDNDEVLLPILLCNLLDTLLTLQVKGTRRRSDKALGLTHHGLSPCTPDTGLNGWPLYTVPFTNNDHFLAF